jgi:hypothetical protein
MERFLSVKIFQKSFSAFRGKGRTALILAAINKKSQERLGASTIRCDQISSVDVSEIGPKNSFGEGETLTSVFEKSQAKKQ